jgi:hypothetical protein
MYLTLGGVVIHDYNLELLREVLETLDNGLVRLDRMAEQGADPDEEGLVEPREHLLGVGLAACQRYLASTAAFVHLPKTEALQYGPRHRSGETLVALVNAGANFWKHADEWAMPRHTSLQALTLGTLSVLGVDHAEAPLDAVFRSLCLDPSPKLVALLPHLEAWRDELPRNVSLTPG